MKWGWLWEIMIDYWTHNVIELIIYYRIMSSWFIRFWIYHELMKAIIGCLSHFYYFCWFNRTGSPIFRQRPNARKYLISSHITSQHIIISPYHHIIISYRNIIDPRSQVSYHLSSIICDTIIIIIIIIIIKPLLKIFNECRSLTGGGRIKPLFIKPLNYH